MKRDGSSILPFGSRGPLARRVMAGLVVGAVLVAGLLVPIPIYFLYVPGPVRDVQRLVKVSHASTYSSEGRLYMTTVGVDVRVTAAELFLAALDPKRTVVEARAVTGGRSLDELAEQQRREMLSSKQLAEEVALTELGLAQASGDGARVLDTDSAVLADGVLRPDDVIVSVEGMRVETICDVDRALDAVEVGETVSVALRRDERLERVEVDTAPDPSDPSSPYVGVLMTMNYRFDSGVGVQFETGRVAGPSAGLMFALALFDRLTPSDLTDGRVIAGTGTIGCDGAVGSIGGITQKVAGAEAEGAQLFLAPAANAEEARRAAEDIEVVAVSSFGEALDRLEGAE
jgi:PDZ domain-containing protein